MSSTTQRSLQLPPSIRRMLHERLESTNYELPFLPTTSAEVLAMVGEEGCDAQRLAEIVQRDQSLAANVMRISNSAAYAPKEPIVSLQQAVSRLGLGVIGEIAIAVSLRGRVFEVPGHQVKIRQMWMHSAVTAFYAREVARVVRHNVEGAYMCGLLHDVGRPLVMQALIDLAAAKTEKPVPIGILDAAMVEFHAPLGSRLAEHWKLPEWVTEAVLYHHEWRSAGLYAKEAMITRLADLLAHWALDEALGESDFSSEDPVIEELGLYADDLTRLFGQRNEVIDLADTFV